jgi:sulfofructose kinase
MSSVPPVDLVGVGLNATDTVISLPHYPAPGSKVEFRQSAVLPGGQVATVVVACRHWGMQTRYVGKLGDDHAAALHRDAFARAGVEAQLVTAHGVPSPQSIILVSPDGDRTVLCRRDDQVALQPEELQRDWIEHARMLHLDGFETAAATQAARWARAAGVPVMGDLDELYDGIEHLLPNIDYLIVSSDFPCRLMNEPNLDQALRGMHQRYGCTLTAATLGEDGVLAWDGEQMYFSAAYRVSVVDTTGAGDVFRAGFIYGLHQGWPLDRRLDFACAAAALNCMATGARGGIRSVDEIEQLMRTGVRYPSSIPAASAR